MMLKTLVDQVNYIDILNKTQCSVGKSWILGLMWMLL